MANMTRANFEVELQARGWSRYLETDLDRYLDWALQDVYNKIRAPRTAPASATVSASTADSITYTTIATTPENVQRITGLSYKNTGGDVFRLNAADEEFFLDVMLPNSRATTKVTSAPTHYFVWRRTVYIYPAPQVAVDYYVDYVTRTDSFASDAATTGLPERFDKAVVAAAEVHCARRAHDYDAMAAAMSSLNEFLLDELGQRAGDDMDERVDRILPWRG